MHLKNNSLIIFISIGLLICIACYLFIGINFLRSYNLSGNILYNVQDGKYHLFSPKKNILYPLTSFHRIKAVVIPQDNLAALLSFPQLSRDGNTIVYVAATEKIGASYQEIKIFDLNTNSSKSIFSLKVCFENRAMLPIQWVSWSPMLRSIAFIAGAQSKNPTDPLEYGHLYEISLEDGSMPRKITDKYVFSARPSWSRNGRYIYSTILESNKIAKINVMNGEIEEFFEGYNPVLAHSHDKLVYLKDGNIYSYDLHQKNRELLIMNFNKYGKYYTELVWSPDDSYLLYTRVSQAWWYKLFGYFTLSSLRDIVVFPLNNTDEKIRLIYDGDFSGISWGK